jgi:hypothetical protein
VKRGKGAQRGLLPFILDTPVSLSNASDARGSARRVRVRRIGNQIQRAAALDTTRVRHSSTEARDNTGTAQGTDKGTDTHTPAGPAAAGAMAHTVARTVQGALLEARHSG